MEILQERPTAGPAETMQVDQYLEIHAKLGHKATGLALMTFGRVMIGDMVTAEYLNAQVDRILRLEENLEAAERSVATLESRVSDLERTAREAAGLERRIADLEWELRQLNK